MIIVAQEIMGFSQTAFLSKRSIMESAAVLHETIHELHREKRRRMWLLGPVWFPLLNFS
jgi:hypothetical protein